MTTTTRQAGNAFCFSALHVQTARGRDGKRDEMNENGKAGERASLVLATTKNKNMNKNNNHSHNNLVGITASPLRTMLPTNAVPNAGATGRQATHVIGCFC